MQRVLVAPVTIRVRGVPSELRLGRDEGLPIDSVASFDDLPALSQGMLVRRLGALRLARMMDLCSVAAATLDC
jgi:mRNA-degrading endonuclease toxin of MazEF toxin-antitoxin module